MHTCAPAHIHAYISHTGKNWRKRSLNMSAGKMFLATGTQPPALRLGEHMKLTKASGSLMKGLGNPLCVCCPPL